jgi:hypothetical protein
MARLLFTVTDPKGQMISLTNRCYQDHMLLAHPEMMDIDEIRQTIIDPQFIAQDSIQATRLVYYRAYQQAPLRWLKVVVENDEIVTAYRVRRLKKGEPIQWQR